MFFLGATVAVKITKPATVNTIPEINMLGLEHSNIIKTLDVIFGDNYKHYIIIMEYIENTMALSSVLLDKTIKIALETAVKISKDISQGLLYMHEQNVLHLDVKPANVLVCSDGVCKLCDFGSCLVVGGGQEGNYTHQV